MFLASNKPNIAPMERYVRPTRRTLASFQAWLRGGGVGGATGVLVGFWAGEDFVSDADFRGCDFRDSQV